MDILVNNEKINFTLENETSLGQVVDGLNNWLNNSALAITSLKIEERELIFEPKEDWTNLPLDQIKKLNIQAQLLKEIRISNFSNIMALLKILKDSIAGNDTEKIEYILVQYSEMLSSLKTIFGKTTGSTTANEIFQIEQLLIGSTPQMISSWPHGIKKKTEGLLDSLIDKLSERIKECMEPLKSLKLLEDELKKTSIEIGEVSLLLQTGKDKKAMDYIISFSKLSEKVLRILSYLKEANVISIKDFKIDDKSVKDFFNDMNSVLCELIEAFEVKDLVLIGDLLEYEIAPRLESFATFIARIQKNTK